LRSRLSLASYTQRGYGNLCGLQCSRSDDLMKWVTFVPEFIALASFFLKRFFPEDKLVKMIVGESIKRLAPAQLDSKVLQGLEMQFTDSFEIDILRRDVQSACLAAFSGEVILWTSHASDGFSLMSAAVWLVLLLVISRLGGLVETSRSFRRLRFLYFATFIGLVGLSLSIKAYRIIHHAT
jgi:hypothetical protein